MFHRRSLLLAGAAALLLPLVHLADTPASKADTKADDKPAAKKPADKPAAKKALSVAHIKLSGDMDEKAPSVDPLLGQLGETFKGKIDRIKKVRTDSSVQALLLEINGVSVGFGKLNEIAQAIAYVRAGGKKVFAHVESGSTKDYLLALACDDVCTPEATWLMLTGLRLEASFYKGLLEKLGIKADFLQMKEFKGAAEPFIRDSLSDANRKQLTAMLDDFYENELVDRIVKGRPRQKFTADRVKELIDGGPYSARAALSAGLVDRLDYFETYQDTIKAQLKAEEIKLVKDYQKKTQEEIDIFGLYRKLLFGPSKGSSSKGPKVAVIYATGPIMTGKSSFSILGGETVGSETLVKAIQDAEKDDTVKAIVLRVDSPGGSALASDLIWHALKKSKKPVIASMSDVAASGGYYISMSARKIYAEPGTITGSIGVVGGKMALRGLYDKVGIKTESITRGKHAGILSTTDPWSTTEKQAFRSLMQDVYDQFVDKALEGRIRAGKKMTREQLDGLAGGRIWTGRQAKANGLIDELGTLEDAIAEAARLGGIPRGKEPELMFLPKPKGMLEALLGSGLGASVNLGATIRQVPGLAEQLRGVDVLLGLQREPVWAIGPFRLELK